MSVKYVIENGFVYEREVYEGKSVKVEDFMANLAKSVPTCTGRLPKNCIYMERENGKAVIVVQTTPWTIPLKYKARGSNEQQTFKLSMPFIQYWVAINASDAIISVHITCTKENIEEKTQLYKLPVPNQHEMGNSYMCMGDMKIPMELPLHKRIDRVIQEFWSSNFNDDLHAGWPSFLEFTENGNVITGFAGWEKHSASNPMCALMFNYAPHKGKDMATMLSMVKGGMR